MVCKQASYEQCMWECFCGKIAYTEVVNMEVVNNASSRDNGVAARDNSEENH
jgi:hypothetical protein